MLQCSVSNHAGKKEPRVALLIIHKKLLFIALCDFIEGKEKNNSSHNAVVFQVITTPGDPNTFLSCGEDGTVRQFDLRTKTKCLCRDCKEVCAFLEGSQNSIPLHKGTDL